VENKSREDDGSASKWEEAKDQVLGQLKVARAAAPLHAQRTLYAIISVGLYSRFYRLHVGRDTLSATTKARRRPSLTITARTAAKYMVSSMI
jgi:hypothetical protein